MTYIWIAGRWRALALGLGLMAPASLATAAEASWTLPVREAGRALQVVFPCSTTVAGNVLVGNQAYPRIVADYRASFTRMKTMQADVVLPNHPEMADVLGREARRTRGEAGAFIDRGQWPRLVAATERAFDAELARQRASKPGRGG